MIVAGDLESENSSKQAIEQMSTSTISDERQVQVKFHTRRRKYVLPDVAILVPTNLRRFGLSEVVNHLLQPDIRIAFDFLLDGTLLRSSLQEYLDINSLSTENTLSIEVIESIIPPRPLASYQHEDWIADVHASEDGKLYLTGCYDGIVRIWDQSGQCTTTMKGHTGPVKAVRFVDTDKIVSTSQDRSVKWWQCVNDKWINTFESKAHDATIESVAAQDDCTITGDYNGTIKVWLDEDDEVAQDTNSTVDSLTPQKKRKVQNAVKNKVSRMNMNGHVGSVTGLVFGASTSIAYSSGMDHTARQWSVETGTPLTTMSCDHSAMCVDYSHTNNLVASGHSDRFVRLWDPRVKDGAVMKAKLASHQGWVTSVSWCPDNVFHLCSASHDGKVKVWDVRSASPLYTISHVVKDADKVKLFSCHWSRGGRGVIVSAGEDKSLFIDSYQQPAQNSESVGK